MKFTGTVKWFNTEKGYGFIRPDDGQKDVFIHMSALKGAGLNGLKDNQKIEYEIAKEGGKESAVNISLI
ncbi:cold-shock protein [Candidatus Bandiella euplotis]|uniref:Cold shock-like protein CspA n=1 Tax=Candidatus Bandiella euplotis TaxID=1664265 RepID=A0ABZ0UNP1_9RICK|nr:cold-shock protein [Candidatus Bandiella woodruffii]WPX97327.1 Putative cold-shock protein [Candidatus Bandiella woodruffii]